MNEQSFPQIDISANLTAERERRSCAHDAKIEIIESSEIYDHDMLCLDRE